MFLLIFQSVVAWYLGVVLVGFAVAAAPRVELGEADAGPEHQELHGKFGGLAPVVDEIDQLVADIMGNPAWVRKQTEAASSRLKVQKAKCVILVPVAHHIEPDCGRELRALVARGYAVRRVWGYAAIDQGCSQMATDVLAEGFEELMWIDSDIAFEPEAVDRLRSHNLPVVCAIYAKKGQRALAGYIMPDTRQITFGQSGGLLEIYYGATGFLPTQRRVYQDIQRHQNLPVCNTWAGRQIVPFFLPMIVAKGDGRWYLGEDFAFFERLRPNVRELASWIPVAGQGFRIL